MNEYSLACHQYGYVLPQYDSPPPWMSSSMVVDCHIEVGHTHTGGMPVSIHSFCLSSRRASARVHSDGRIEYRTDPQWFTPYMRRETVAW